MIELNKIYNESCLDTLARMPNDFLDCVVTSPPYYGLRSYNTEPQIWDGDEFCQHVWGDEIVNPKKDTRTAEVKVSQGATVGTNVASQHWAQGNMGNFCQLCNAWRGELGLEPTFQLYIEHLLSIFREVHRVLKPTGTVWVNLGDSYVGGKGQSGGASAERQAERNLNGESLNKSHHNETTGFGITRPGDGKQSVRPKSLMNIPHRFAIAMTDELGFIQRNDIIWHKPACMPSSAKDRFTVDFENIFFFTKSPKYWFEQQLEAFQSSASEIARQYSDGFKSTDYATNKKYSGGVGYGQDGRNMRTTWTVNFEPQGEKDGVKMSRLARVPSDAVSGDTKHIVFPDCSACADRLDQVASVLCGEPLTATLKRIGRIDDYLVRGQVSGFGSFVKRLVSDSAAGSCGSFLREYFHSAIGHSTENRRTLREILEHLSDSSFAEILESIDDRQDGLLLSALYFGTRGNSISLDGWDGSLLAKIPHYTGGIFDCSYCQLYHIKTETAQHYASYPTKLVEIPIKAGCPPDGVVYDPFGGTATTAVTSHKLGRQWICSELQPKYAEIAEKRLEPYLAQISLF